MQNLNDLVQDILTHFTNEDQAEVTIGYCNVDQVYISSLTLEGCPVVTEFENTIEEALDKVSKFAQENYGE